jgi:hypothetical protein
MLSTDSRSTTLSGHAGLHLALWLMGEFGMAG